MLHACCKGCRSQVQALHPVHVQAERTASESKKDFWQSSSDVLSPKHTSSEIHLREMQQWSRHNGLLGACV